MYFSVPLCISLLPLFYFHFIMIGIQVSRHLKSMQLGASPDTPVPKFRMAILIEGFNFTRRGKSGHKTMPANLAAWPPA